MIKITPQLAEKNYLRTMRLLLSGMLVGLILSTALRDVATLSAFKLHEDYIANNLCIYRNLEDNMCHGSCQLKLELEKNHDNEKQSGFKLLSDQLPITFFWKSAGSYESPVVLIQSTIMRIVHTALPSEYLFSLFRPPRF
ncbi:MAG: hypothetical protein KDC53_25390 [Saprospiraceae bacterium]|nr:hypothetical protein [Saprospiraceae bacterium]